MTRIAIRAARSFSAANYFMRFGYLASSERKSEVECFHSGMIILPGYFPLPPSVILEGGRHERDCTFGRGGGKCGRTRCDYRY